MNESHDCIQSELIQEHSLQLTELETKSKYKEQSIMEIKKDLKEVNEKLDKLINKSESSDSELRKEVDALRTEFNVYKDIFKTLKDDEDRRTKNLIATCAVIATVTGIIVSFATKFI